MAATVGEVLRTTREERGLTLEQASNVTRVRVQYLQALESDDVYILPSIVQARGFLRLYADYLGLPAQPLLDAWPDGIPVFESPAAQQKELSPEDQPIEKETQPPERVPGQAEPDGEVSSADELSLEVDYADELPPDFIPEAQSGGSQSIFRQIGEDLRQRREAISLSIDEVEKFTHLRAYYIQALEAGRVDRLPSLVQGRGMLANYAGFLDLDVDAVLTRFADALQVRRLELMQPAKKEKGRSVKASGQKVGLPAWRRLLTPDLMIGGALFILFFILVIWGAARVNELSNDTVEPTPPSISEVLLNAGVFTIEPSLEATHEPSISPPAAPIVPAQPSDTPALTSSETIPSPVTNAPLQMNITASQRTWMQVIVDGSVSFQGRTIPGNAYPFTGHSRIELTAGNAAAISIVYNGQRFGSPGTMGEVVRLIFTAEGILTPTAQFTPTPTLTQAPTNTLRPSPMPKTPTVTPLIP